MGAQWNLNPGAGPGEVGRVRRSVRDELTRLGVGPVDDAELMAWELLTNAVRHTNGPIAILLTAHDTNARIEVFDDSHRHAERKAFDPERIGGHGIELVDRLSIEWGEALWGRGKSVWFEVPRDVPGPNR